MDEQQGNKSSDLDFHDVKFDLYRVPEVPEHANFCSACGSLLDLSNVSVGVECEVCHRTVPKEEYERNRGKVCMTEELEPSEFLLRLRGTQDTVEKVKMKETLALVNEVCPKCSHPQMSYRTAQLRSADEGQSIFYKCPKCQYEMTVHS